jgi:ABC-type multidrug transport system fused ATPase/permease subunit
VDAGWADGPTVLSGLSLRVEHGEHVALAGPSGAGKSTVASLLLGHLTARAGTVRVDGIDPVRNPAGARSRIAAVQQRAFHFLGTIEDNLRLAAPAVTEARLWEALELAGLRADVEAMPAGLATPVGEQGALLSGGQSQRLAIAQAWLQDAPILVLDEPTSQVDLAAEEQILAALRRLAADRTVLMIAHRPGAILAADRVIRLDPARPAGDEARPGAAARPGAEAPGSTRAGEGTR